MCLYQRSEENDAEILSVDHTTYIDTVHVNRNKKISHSDRDDC